MLKYLISYPGVLPDSSRWIEPKYFGPGDFITRNNDSSFNDPKKWRIDFPNYVYTYFELQNLKTLLNTCKKQLDPINANSNDEKRFSLIFDLTRSYDDLRGKNGIIATQYGGEIVTNAWLKMYELCHLLDPMLGKISASRNRSFTSVSLAEAPGNFILAINHYLQNHHSVDWSWWANTYRSNNQDTIYLSDNYGLIRRFPKKWLFGCDNDGDITSGDNLKSIAHSITEKVHLVTSDVKYVPKNVNFDEEENINIPVHLGHVLGSLVILSKGGTAVLKEFTFFEAQSISLLWLLNCCFSEILIVKPETSKPANSEVYLVCNGYKRNLKKLELDKLFNYLRYIRKLNTEDGSPSLFMKQDIPADFVARICEIQQDLVNNQIENINKNISLFNHYKTTPVNVIRQNQKQNRADTAQQWIKTNNLKSLSPNKHIID